MSLFGLFQMYYALSIAINPTTGIKNSDKNTLTCLRSPLVLSAASSSSYEHDVSSITEDFAKKTTVKTTRHEQAGKINIQENVAC